MQVFVPYKSPFRTAVCLDGKRLRKQIIESRQIIAAIEGTGKGWINHPVTHMYAKHTQWLRLYTECLEAYASGDTAKAVELSVRSMNFRPEWMDERLCIQYRRRLYTKNPMHYAQFAIYGQSQENWYIIDNILKRYINGKIIGQSKYIRQTEGRIAYGSPEVGCTGQSRDCGN